jgi:hypothetical protein
LQVKVHHRYQQHPWQICHWCHRHRRQNCRHINDTGGPNFTTSFSNVVDTGGKCAACINNTGSKFAAGINDTSGK